MVAFSLESFVDLLKCNSYGLEDLMVAVKLCIKGSEGAADFACTDKIIGIGCQDNVGISICTEQIMAANSRGPTEEEGSH